MPGLGSTTPDLLNRGASSGGRTPSATTDAFISPGAYIGMLFNLAIAGASAKWS